MADFDDRERDRRDAGAPYDRRNRWVPWVIGAVVLLLLLLALRTCHHDADDTATVRTGDHVGAVTAPDNPNAPGRAIEPVSWNREAFTTYLGGTEPVGRVFALDRVTFDSGSAKLKGDAKDQIGELASALKEHPDARVSLRGYADPAGDAAANQKLSQERTDAVRQALVDAGAGGGQVASAQALGETGNAAVEANRRVEITVDAR